jgi:hypothetical protein
LAFGSAFTTIGSWRAPRHPPNRPTSPTTGCSAFERHKDGGRGDKTLLYDGRRVRHYALTDHNELFAEMTEAHFGANDFFPFNRAELKGSEPDNYALLRDIWGRRGRA